MPVKQSALEPRQETHAWLKSTLVDQDLPEDYKPVFLREADMIDAVRSIGGIFTDLTAHESYSDYMTNQTNRIQKIRDLSKWENLAMEHLATLQQLKAKLDSLDELLQVEMYSKHAELLQSAKAAVDLKLRFLQKSESHWSQNLHVDSTRRKFRIGKIGVIFCRSGSTRNPYDLKVYTDFSESLRSLTTRKAQKTANLGTTTTTTTTCTTTTPTVTATMTLNPNYEPKIPTCTVAPKSMKTIIFNHESIVRRSVALLFSVDLLPEALARQLVKISNEITILCSVITGNENEKEEDAALVREVVQAIEEFKLRVPSTAAKIHDEMDYFLELFNGVLVL